MIANTSTPFSGNQLANLPVRGRREQCDDALCDSGRMSGGDGSRDTWDFFISYTQSDRGWAEWIAWLLEERRFRVLVQAWDFVPGTNWVQGMQDGVTRADRTIALLSPDYLESVYGGAEWQTAWAADPTGAARKLLPVRVAECDRPGFLSGVVGIYVFGVNEATARSRISRMVTGAIKGDLRPDQPPPFPPNTRAISREARFPGTMPNIWNVPARNPHFVGRKDDLAKVAAGLADGLMTVHSLRGLGGVGKTQLANEYAQRHATEYDLVWWIAAEQPALIPDEFARLAEKLEVDSTGDPRALAEVVHTALRQVPGWLLIFDNADDVADIKPWLPAGPVPPGGRGHVLVTTRRSGFGGLGGVLDLDVVDIDEAVQLMRARVPALAEEVGRQIAEEFDRLPLALEQAAAYMDSTGIPAEEYLALLRTRAQDMFRRGTTARGDVTIETLWDLSLERVAANRLASAQLLDLCAYLAPEPIPLDLFTGHPDLLPERLASACADAAEFNDTIAALVDFSLVKRTPAGLQLHRLVQAAIRTRHHRTTTTTAGTS
jgi:hypothetical protein